MTKPELKGQGHEIEGCVTERDAVGVQVMKMVKESVHLDESVNRWDGMVAAEMEPKIWTTIGERSKGMEILWV